MALQDFAGSVVPKLTYSDNSKELISSIRSLGWSHDLATDNRPQTNGVIERQNRNILEGLRSSLWESGLEHKCWSQAATTWCHLNNFSRVDPKDGLTSWQRRHGKAAKFDGILAPFGSLVHYLPTADREVYARQKAGPRMVPGLFAGYKLLHNGLWKGEYLVYDKEAYELWNGTTALPVHTTKELYLLGAAGDSRDADVFQFPVRDGDWKSKCVEAPKYVQKHHYKRKPMPTSTKTPERTDDVAPDIEGSHDMFDDLLERLSNRSELNGEAQADSSSGDPSERDSVADEPKYPPDEWVRRGEYIIRKHYAPRDTLFSPTRWRRDQLAKCLEPRINVQTGDPVDWYDY